MPIAHASVLISIDSEIDDTVDVSLSICPLLRCNLSISCSLLSYLFLSILVIFVLLEILVQALDKA